MLFSAYFSESGVPKEGLTPLISIYNITDGVMEVENGTMIEVGGGFYKYEHSVGIGKEYSSICDSVTLTGNERYAIGEIESTKFDIKRLLGLVHENLLIDNASYDKYGNMKEARMRLYSDSVSVGTENNIIATYRITADAKAAGKVNTWKQTLEAE